MPYPRTDAQAALASNPIPRSAVGHTRSKSEDRGAGAEAIRDASMEDIFALQYGFETLNPIPYILQCVIL